MLTNSWFFSFAASARPVEIIKIAAAIAVVMAGTCAHAAQPELELSQGPMSGSANMHPNVLLSLSLDRTASRAAYMNGYETYDRTREYLGYFNPRKCYAYRGGNRNIATGYFSIEREADAVHECSASFSGNFMNWAATSLLDVFRYALTGGDRIVDTPESTILQRAFLSDAAYAYAYAGYFPRKSLKASGNASAPNRVTPFNVDELFIVSCRNRILFSDVLGGPAKCDASAYDERGKLAISDKRLGEYLVRVQVCDRYEGSQRTELCQAYGKYYKPVGVIQRYANTMRFAAMGYLLDASEGRYGGVLKSPMNYVGEDRFAYPDFVKEANPISEWDPDTGVLYAGSNASGGTINYINRIGRSGNYRQFDPIAELYYEGLRYLQNKPPSKAATESIQEEMTDGFPLVASNTDPVTAACQRNYLLAFGDANTHWDRYLPGNQRTTFHGSHHAFDNARPVEPATAGKTPMLDARAWTAKVGDMEADTAGHYTNPAPRRDLAKLHLLDTGEAGHGSYYMAGLAYWANTQEIRQDKPISVRTLVMDLDEGGNGSLDGGTRAVKPKDSQLFLAAKYGGFRDANQDGNPYVTYETYVTPADGRKSLLRFDTNEWDIENSGRPETYFLAGDPEQLVAGIRNMFALIANDGTDAFTQVTRHSALVPKAVSGAERSFLYRAGYDRVRWSGSLQKFFVEHDHDGNAKRSAMPLWDAGALLTGSEHTPPRQAPGQRKIYTSVTQPDAPMRTVEFTWQALESAQRRAFDILPGQVMSDGLGSERIEYLRGERTRETGRENGVFRARRSVLGDIVNSAPVFAGAPTAISPDADYPEFRSRYTNRPHAIYVGANDGMLHAFDADTGAELFAYVPNTLLHTLPLLTQPHYVHRPYVDGSIAVADAKLAGTWRTVLAAGMGAGAQGLFALDVSDPGRFEAGMGALWEFTDSDDPDIGNIMGAPQIAKLRTNSNGAAAYEYFVIVPSGLNASKPDGTGKSSRTAQAALFLLSLQKDPKQPWKLGVNYYKIRLPAGEPGLPNGLSQPVLAGGADGAVRHAYAGDLQGNLWRFDFMHGKPWSKALGASPKPLFTARDDAGQRQPISTQPKLVYATNNAYMLLFGTGKFIEASDAAPGHFDIQSFYGVLDKPDMREAVNGRKALLPHMLTASLEAEDVIVRSSSAGGLPHTLDAKGWFFDFPDSKRTGERLVYTPVVAAGRLYFSTLVPSASPCERDGARLYAMDVLTGLPVNGTAIAYTLEPGTVGSPLVMRDTLESIGPIAGGRRKAKQKHALIDPNDSGKTQDKFRRLIGRDEIVLPAGRLSWREISNWQELRDEALKK